MLLRLLRRRSLVGCSTTTLQLIDCLPNNEVYDLHYQRARSRGSAAEQAAAAAAATLRTRDLPPDDRQTASVACPSPHLREHGLQGDRCD